jgi:hypothetical protein
MLEFACGAAKLKYPDRTIIIGIAIDAPKYSDMNSEDFILMDCTNWTAEDQTYYETANKELRFFQTSALTEHRMHVAEFPPKPSENKPN